MKIWVDDIRPAPEGYVRCFSVNETLSLIEDSERVVKESLELLKTPYSHHECRQKRYEKSMQEQIDFSSIELIDIDHDAGDATFDGGDYINILNWLEETGRSYPIRIHSMNPVGVENMRRIIERNGWREVK